ncbi:MAG TPA: DNRLRE domain-containing protein [Anaerolineae bacterium]|nr:DNRLRE domain-containing protein [Anaerolineae bacterium]HQI83470.1 DNRLRE domain-containing protein [Anaerolineae bacterium]
MSVARVRKLVDKRIRVPALIWGGLLASLLIVLPVTAQADPPTRRVHAPYFSSNVLYPQTAIFWFGRITPTENYTDVRVGYNDSHLYVNFAVSDRRLWYDTSPAPADMTAWDAATLYLDLDGNTGSVPDADAYRFIAQLNFWESRAGYQVAYRGDGVGWTQADIAFTATSGWRGDAPNTNADDRGWTMTFVIPFTSLGLSGKPATGDMWGLSVAVHDRDDAGGTPIADTFWPETLQGARPETWGELVFGRPPAYVPKPYVPGSEKTTTIRDRLNGATVVDGAVGGHTTCGGGLDYWTQWGEKNYAGLWIFNIQNQADISDWPCNSKYYVTFPLDLVPADKIIVDAKVTLHQFGGAGAGWTPPAQPSLIQTLTVEEPWNEFTLAWNNAPLAAEFVSATWVDPTSVYLGQPGKPWTWDVTSAVAAAYADGKPLSLVFYEADAAYHSGKYFRTSEEEEFDAVGRPTLVVTWAEPVATLNAVAWPREVEYGDVVVFNLIVTGSGHPLTLTDWLPNHVSPPVSLAPGLTFTAPDRFTWMGAPAYNTQVVLGYAVTVTTSSRVAIYNRAILTQTATVTDSAYAVVFVDPLKVYLPIVNKR